MIFFSKILQLGMLPQITEVDNESNITTSLDDDENTGNGNSEAQFYNSRVPFASWSTSKEASHFQESLTGHKRELDHEDNVQQTNTADMLGLAVEYIKTSKHSTSELPTSILAYNHSITHQNTITDLLLEQLILPIVSNEALLLSEKFQSFLIKIWRIESFYGRAHS